MVERYVLENYEDLDRLREYVALDYEHLGALLNSKNPNTVLEGKLISLGYNRAHWSEKGEIPIIPNLYLNVSEILLRFAARQMYWRQEDISDSINEGAKYHQKALMLQEATGESPRVAWLQKRMVTKIKSRNSS